jgi:hypothetical protein
MGHDIQQGKERPELGPQAHARPTTTVRYEETRAERAVVLEPGPNYASLEQPSNDMNHETTRKQQIVVVAHKTCCSTGQEHQKNPSL